MHGTTLEALSQNAQTPLWSTQPVLDNPAAILEAHLAFLRAGARIIMTATYQAAVDTFKKAGYTEIEAQESMLRCVRLAKQARQSFVTENSHTGQIVRIALSLGPFGATLSPPQEFNGYYPPPYGPMGQSTDIKNLRNCFDEDDKENEERSIEALTLFHLERLLIFARDPETWRTIDIIAFETVPLVREALAIRKAMLDLKRTIIAEGIAFVEKPWWISFVLPSGKSPQGATAADLTRVALSATTTWNDVDLPRPMGIGINCTAPRFICGLANEFAESVKLLRPPYRPWLVLYPDAGDIYNISTRSWFTPPNDTALSWAVTLKTAIDTAKEQGVWQGVAAGGCCRVGPDLIQELSDLQQVFPTI
ncbi:hypothetical protein H0H93_003513 [Arthromyces matolae]|nr:hypothetical protein H0H93_003513 [Arthromyces matolae]